MNAILKLDSLLMLYVSIIGHEQIKVFLCQPEKFTILFSGPSRFRNRFYVMISKFEFELLRQTLIDENPHLFKASSKDCPSS
jgi:hypothetical protein